MALGTADDLRGAERRTLGKLLSVRFGGSRWWRSDSGVNLEALTVMMGSFCGVSNRVITISSKQMMKLKQLGS